ncbi:glycosyltransferase family 39 protein [Acidipropionibacterium jensenii]|uniref:glycosyltransferase family 39 protein n=1 Tax=Acidipropionibacterium jensenii TaxID=1749 RepID=UPI001586415E|nr:glycosyltransferase family 39 protein [Acidipropionibacterium jensenii]
MSGVTAPQDAARNSTTRDPNTLDTTAQDAASQDTTERRTTLRAGARGGSRRSSLRAGRVWRAASLGLLLLAIGCLYIIGLSASGWANSFYSAAAQAASQSWKALFFGSSDAANFITVDKPPAFLWIIGISVRIFGVNSWAILVPEALEGVSAAAVLYVTVRRVLAHGGWRDVTPETSALHNRAHWAAMGATAIFATVPSATLMFRYNNPDALLTLLLVVATYCVLRACEKGSRGWLAWAGTAVGFAFLTKMLQSFLVLPALLIAYVITAPRSWRHKLVDLLTALGTMVLSAGWYIAVFELVPASSRPYMGGSQTNSFLELVLGYNGLGRITGNETGSVVPGGTTGAGSWGRTGITRLFDGTSAGMVTWFIPAALILSVTAVVLIGRRGWVGLSTRRLGPSNARSTPSTQTLAGVIATAGSLVVTALTFSFMSGIYHDYYTVALAPWIGGAVGLGAAVCWQHRDRWTGRIALAASTAVTAGYAIYLFSQAGGAWMILAAAVGVAGLVASLGLLLGPLLPAGIARASLAIAPAAGLAGPVGYSVNTAATPHTGAIITAGPVSSGQGGGPGGAGGQAGRTSRGGPGGQAGQRQPQNGQGGPGQSGTGSTRTGRTPGAGQTGGRPNGMAAGQSTGGTNGSTPARQGGRPGSTGGGMGGLNGSAQVSTAARTLLSSGAGSYTWVAAVTGSNNAASYQLATGYPVMAVGGYNGTEPAPTLSQFKQLVAQGRIHFYISTGSGGAAGSNAGSGSTTSGSSASSEISTWVAKNFTAQSVGGTSIYDLSQATS